MKARAIRTVLTVLTAALLAGCAGGGPTTEQGGTPVPRSPSSSSDGLEDDDQGGDKGRGPVSRPPGTVPPPWLGSRVLPEAPNGFGVVRPTPPELRLRRFTLPDRLPALPGTGFASQVTDPAPADVLARSTWAPGCPVGRRELAWVRLAFIGFDGQRHTGELLVNARVVDDVVTVFRRLYEARFPIEEMRVTGPHELDAPPTGDGNNTGAFVCRPSRGDASSYSEHAYGLAVDVNPFQNPYTRGSGADRVVLPELASAYLDRGRRAPGMVHPGGPVVRAFASVGWGWGGAWQHSKDYQHFSASGG